MNCDQATKLQLFEWLYTVRRIYVSRFPQVRHICFLVNNYCNLQCDFCDIWQSESRIDLSREKMLNFIRQLKRQPLSIQISGGEPFLREDIACIVSELKRICSHSKCIITTNGTLPHQVQDFFHRLPSTNGLHITLSLNGLEKNIYDGSDSDHYRRFMSTLQVLNSQFPDIPKTIKMIIRKFDIEMIEAAYEFVRTHGAYFQLKFEELALSYHNRTPSREELAAFEKPPWIRMFSLSEKKEIISGIKKILAQTQYDEKLRIVDRLYLRAVQRHCEGERARRIPCPVYGNYVMMMADGTLNPCRYVTKLYHDYEESTSCNQQDSIATYKDDFKCPEREHACVAFWNFFI